MIKNARDLLLKTIANLEYLYIILIDKLKIYSNR